MAKQKPGVYDRVLECAKDEFLSKGFLDASLRAIAQEAGTSTGSIYTRFGDKEGLFRAIVEPVVDQRGSDPRRIQWGDRPAGHPSVADGGAWDLSKLHHRTAAEQRVEPQSRCIAENPS